MQSSCSVRIVSPVIRLAVALLAIGFWQEAAQAGPILIYSQVQTISPGIPRAVPTSMPLIDISDIGNASQGIEVNNCFVEEGCLATIGPGISLAVRKGPPLAGLPEGNMPDRIPFPFTFTGEDIAAIKRTPGLGTLSIEAARDIGPRQREKTPNDVGDGPFYEDDPRSIEILVARSRGITGVEDILLGDLFKTPKSDCLPGENADAFNNVLDETCGPNFHTDATATDTLVIPRATFLRLIGELEEPGGLNIDLIYDGSGRLKIFSATLTYAAPEPATFILFGAGLAALGFMKRRVRIKWPGVGKTRMG